MKILEQVQAVFAKYELKPIEIPAGYDNLYKYLRDNLGERNYIPEKDDIYFLRKYRVYISKGHYGFAVGTPTIPAWSQILDEILEICIATDHKFEIQQIKMKFGGIRFYVESNVIEDLLDVEKLIEKTLFDKALIY
jgi:hypothetical protein